MAGSGGGTPTLRVTPWASRVRAWTDAASPFQEGLALADPSGVGMSDASHSMGPKKGDFTELSR